MTSAVKEVAQAKQQHGCLRLADAQERKGICKSKNKKERLENSASILELNRSERRCVQKFPP